MDAIKEKIRIAIVESGLSRAEVERQAGIPPKTISKWFHSSLNSYKDYLPQLAKVLNKNISWFYDESPVPANEDGLTDKQRELIQIVRSSSPLEVDLLLAQAKIEIARRKSQG